MDYFNNNDNNIIVKSRYDEEYYYYYCLICSTGILFILWLFTITYIFIGNIDYEKRVFVNVNSIKIPISLILFLISCIFSVIYCKLLNYQQPNDSEEKNIKKIMIELNKCETVVNSQNEIEL